MRGGYREAGCATMSLVDGEGERLHSVRMGRMPESNKTTLKTMVAPPRSRRFRGKSTKETR